MPSLQTTTGYLSFSLISLFSLRQKAHLPNEYAVALQKSLGSAFECVWKNFQFRLCRQKDFYDYKIHRQHYEQGALVWLHSSVVPKEQFRKLHHSWTGPYCIVKQLSDVTYPIQHTQGRKNHLVVHIDRLKPCIASTLPDPTSFWQPPGNH